MSSSLCLLWVRFEQGYFTLFRHEQQQVLVREQEYLARAIAALFPFQFAFVEGDASEELAGEAIHMITVSDEVVEVRTDGAGFPELLGIPFVAVVSDAQPMRSAVERGAEQEVGVAHGAGLNATGGAVELPFVVPEHGAVFGLQREQAVASHHEGYLDAIDLGGLQGAVAELAVAGVPGDIAGVGVIGHYAFVLAAGEDQHHSLHDQGGRREAPPAAAWLRSQPGCRATRASLGSAGGVKTAQLAGLPSSP